MSLFKRLFGRSKVDGSSCGAAQPATPAKPKLEIPLAHETVSGARAEQRLKELSQQGEADGFFPVIIGEDEDAQTLFESYQVSEGVEAILKAAEQIDIDDWMRETQQQDPEFFEGLETGIWPDKVMKPSGLSSPYKILSGRPKKQVYILKVPAEQPWHIPAHLSFGGWNECPMPEVQVAFARHWYEQYGAVIVANTGDVLEYAVRRPPTTKELAETLAYEQFIFCTDIVYQGCQTLRNLAATLIGAPYWYFWWD